MYANLSGMALVHIGRALFGEPWGTYTGMRRSSLVFHDKLKKAGRLKGLHVWAEANHCDAPQISLNCDWRRYASCAGAMWRRCTTVQNDANGSCPTGKTNASSVAYKLAPTRKRTSVLTSVHSLEHAS